MIVAVGIHHLEGPRESKLLLDDMRRFAEERRKNKRLAPVTAVKDET